MKQYVSVMVLVNALSLPALAFALPSSPVTMDSNPCFSHLSDMVRDHSLNLREWVCVIKNDNDMATLTAFLDSHPDVTELDILPPAWNFDLPDTVRVSIKPLTANKTLTKLRAFSGAPGDSAGFASNSTLQTLDLYGEVTDEDIEAIASNTSLQSFSYNAYYNAFKNTLTDRAAIALAKNSSMTHICLEDAKFTDAGMLALANKTNLTGICSGGNDAVALALSHNKNLSYLSLDAKNMSDAAVLAIADMPTLKTLSVNYASNKAIQGIAANEQITDLAIYHNPHIILGEEELRAIGRMNNLTALSLYFVKMTSKGSAALAQLPALTQLDILTENFSPLDDEFFVSVAQNPSIKSLSIRYNGTGEFKPANLAALAQSTTLEELRLKGGRVDDECALALSDNRSLRKLDLGVQRIRNKGAIALARMPLTWLNLDMNQIENEGAMALANNEHLKTLNLINNRMGDEGVVALAKNLSLSRLYLNFNKITDQSAIALAKSTTLKVLLVKWTGISQSGIESLMNNPGFISLNY